MANWYADNLKLIIHAYACLLAIVAAECNNVYEGLKYCVKRFFIN